MAYNGEESSNSGHDEPWIQWFCGLKGHEMFCEVERAYIEDGFNLYGLRACVSNFSDCLDLILDRIGPDDSDDSHLTQSACTLYGLIHARYVVTAHGLDAMYNKYASKDFGTCPLVQCNGQPVLPVGLKDEIGVDTVKIFCPKCQCVYQPPPIRSRSSSHHHHGNGGGAHHAGNGGGSGAVDGAAFGTTFPHLFLMTFNNLVPDPLPKDSKYVPRVFGFRVHKSAKSMHQTGAQGTGTGGRGQAFAAQGTSRRGRSSAEFASHRGAATSTNNNSAQGGAAAGGGGDDGLRTAAPIQELATGAPTDNKPAAPELDKSKTTVASGSKSGGKAKGGGNGGGGGNDNGGGGAEEGGGDGGGNSNASSPKRKSKSGGDGGGKNNSGSGNENGNGTPKSRSSKRQKQRPNNSVDVT